MILDVGLEMNETDRKAMCNNKSIYIIASKIYTTFNRMIA
jgi:hypothetical protein